MNKLGTPRTLWQYAPACFLFALASLCCAVADADNSEPMLYFFTSKGCAPCIQVKHVVKQLGDEGYPVTTVDVGERPDWADAFRVTHTPTLALVKGNEVLAWQPRPMRAQELRDWFRTIRYSPVPKTNPKAAVRTATEPATRTRPAQTKISIPATRTSTKSNLSFSSSTMHKGTRQPANDLEYEALAATVRLQVKDEGGTSYATGTVIHTHQGESLIVTCGHVFRESKGRGEVTVEIGFEDGSPIKVPGKVLDYDSNANDIALVEIRNGSFRLPAIEIAPADSIVDRGDLVFSLGCDRGDDPTIRNTAIKNLARYDGSMKYDIFGRPVNGRSGGGLFNDKGQLIGVCNAAAVEVDEGIYTALETVHWQIAKANLSHLFERSLPASGPDRQLLAANRGPSRVQPTRKMVPIRRSRTTAPGSRSMASNIRNVSLEQPVGSYGDREVIITVRSKTNPQDSRTITISDPTPKLLDYLDGMEGEESRSMKYAEYREWK